MNMTFSNVPTYPALDYEKELKAIKRASARRPRDRKSIIAALAATGMHDPKTGEVLKKFR